MNTEIKEMFDDYSNISHTGTDYVWNELFSLSGFTIFYRSVGLHTGLMSERYLNLKIFYDELKKSGDLKEARVKSGFNQKQAKYYIDVLNNEFDKKLGTIFFERKIRVKRRITEFKNKVTI